MSDVNNFMPYPAGDRAAAVFADLMLSPYDELVEIDRLHGQMRCLKHAEGKFFVPVADSTVRDMRRYSAENMIHPDDRELYLRETDPDMLDSLLDDAEIPGVLRDRFRYRMVDGTWHWVEQVSVGGDCGVLPRGIYYTFLFDIQDLVDGRGSLSDGGGSVNSALRSPLTGLLVEHSFFDYAQSRLTESSENMCMIALDLEHFKLFNEWYGRSDGDLLPARIGAKLMYTEICADGVAGYFGQDDFALLMPYDKKQIETLYTEVHGIIKEYGNSVGFMPAVGIAKVDGACTAVELYDRAATAAHHAKENFHTRIREFDPAMYKKTERDYQILSDFQKAIEEQELFIMLQPQCQIFTGKVVGAESLVRWKKSDGTMVSPGVFVPVLEQYGFVTDLDKYVWEQVCAWQRSWIDRGHTPLPVSVNVSQIDIFTIDVPDYFDRLIKKYALPVDVVKVEITESAYVDNDSVVDVVTRLRELGFLVLMDDFGSGYSSLNMLRSVNVDIIKLDAQFLRMNSGDHKGVHILESIVNMAKTMGVPIIVEGVETKEETEFLSGLGCRYVQGYYFYRPMSVESFEALIGDPAKIDTGGFVFELKEQFHIREFLDQNVFSDAMLNNILGPVAFFTLHDGELDCVRYNQQFCNEVHSELFDTLLRSCQQYVLEEDLPVLYGLLEQAMNDPLGGASDVLRFPRANGATAQYRLQLYFLGEDETGKRFYGSMRDITQLDRINSQMRLVSRLSNDEVIFLRSRGGRQVQFQVTVHGLEGMIGLSREEFEWELNNHRFHERLKPEDWRLVEQIVYDRENVSKDFSPPFPVKGAGGQPFSVQIRLDSVHDKNSGVEYLLIVRKSAV
jgi:diguanylate cyclase (GGDEF)-like protein